MKLNELRIMNRTKLLLWCFSCTVYPERRTPFIILGRIIVTSLLYWAKTSTK